VSSPILTGPKRILARWRQRHQPVLQLEPVMTDDDVDFHSDLHYFRDLLEAIHTRSIYERAPIAAFPTIMSTTLDIALYLVRKDFPDDVAAELARWRADIAAAAA
jgi:hypothetical protein